MFNEIDIHSSVAIEILGFRHVFSDSVKLTNSFMSQQKRNDIFRKGRTNKNIQRKIKMINHTPYSIQYR